MEKIPSTGSRQKSESNVASPRLASTRKRKRFDPQRRLEVAKVRKAGACSDCRRKKIGCIHALQGGEANVMAPSLAVVEKEVFSPLQAIFYAPVECESSCIEHEKASTAPSASIEVTDISSQLTMMTSFRQSWTAAQAPMLNTASTNTPRSASVVKVAPLDYIDKPIQRSGDLGTPSQSTQTNPPLTSLSFDESLQARFHEQEDNEQSPNTAIDLGQASHAVFSAEDPLPVYWPNNFPAEDDCLFDEESTGLDSFESLVTQQNSNASPTMPLSSSSSDTFLAGKYDESQTSQNFEFFETTSTHQPW